MGQNKAAKIPFGGKPCTKTVVGKGLLLTHSPICVWFKKRPRGPQVWVYVYLSIVFFCFSLLGHPKTVDYLMLVWSVVQDFVPSVFEY